METDQQNLSTAKVPRKGYEHRKKKSCKENWIIIGFKVRDSPTTRLFLTADKNKNKDWSDKKKVPLIQLGVLLSLEVTDYVLLH